MTLTRVITALFALFALLAPTCARAQAAPPPLTDAQVALIAAMTQAGQRDPATQRALVHHFRQGAVLYLHHLDKIAPQALFSLGDETRFVAAIGSTDGSDHNRVFVAPAKSPHHVDAGPYVLPPDFLARSPLSPTQNLYWHEVQHDLLDRAGVGINPRPYGASMDTPAEATGLGSMSSLTADYHHPIIEGLGQRGAEAYGRLAAFEAAARAAHGEQRAIEATRAPTFAELRHIWSVSHQRFSLVTQAWGRVASLPPDTVGAYQAATGVFFSPPEALATFYREGGLKSGGADGANVGQDVRVPKWVFYPTLYRMPARIHVVEDPPAPQGTQTHLTRTFTVDVFARGSVHELDVRPGLDIYAISRPLAEGTLTVTLEGGDEQAVVHVQLPKGTVHDRSSRHREAKLNAEPLKVMFHIPDLRRTTERTTYTLRLAFADDLREPLFDTAERRIEIEVDPPKLPAAAASTASTPKRAVPAASAPKSAFKGHWKLAEIERDDAEGRLTLSPGRARFRMEGGDALCVASFTWVEPKARFSPGEAFTLALDLSLDEHQAVRMRQLHGQTTGGCRIDGAVSAGERGRFEGDRESAYVVAKFDGTRAPARDRVTREARFPEPWRTSDGDAKGTYYLTIHPAVGSVVYRYEWVDEEEKDELSVRVQLVPDPSERAPVPPPYTPAPIAPEALTGPRPPVPPPEGGLRPRVQPVPFQPPGGDYRIVLPPGWTPLARVDGEYLYADPNNAYVLACPPRARRYPGAFVDQRDRLASELVRREIVDIPMTPRYGRHDGLVLRGVDAGPVTTHAFVASEGRAVLFRVIAAPGVAPPLPSVLEAAFATVEWTAGGPVTPAR